MRHTHTHTHIPNTKQIGGAAGRGPQSDPESLFGGIGDSVFDDPVVPTPSQNGSAAVALGGGGGGGGDGSGHALPGTHNRPDLGEGFHDVLNGLSYDCPLCGCTKHLSTRVLDERTAAKRLQAWAEQCPADADEHRNIGKRLLIDFSFAD